MSKHQLCISTVKTLLERKKDESWRDYAWRLGYARSYAATLNKAARGIPGAMSSEAEAILRERLGITSRTRRHYHRPCMDDETYARYIAWRKEQA